MKTLLYLLKMKKYFNQVINVWNATNYLLKRIKKVRDHDHITGKYRGSADSNCNINLRLTKNVFVIFPNLRVYRSHLIAQKIDKFDAEWNRIPNEIEKNRASIIDKNLVFIDSIQFTNFILDELVKNLTDNDFKYYVKNLEVIC